MILCKCVASASGTEAALKFSRTDASPDKIYTRMKRFITKALSRYSKLITLSFAFILYNCARSGGFSLSCRDIGGFYYILDKGDFGGGYL